jgi:hypothetical protein
MIRAFLLTLSGIALVLWAINEGPIAVAVIGVVIILLGAVEWELWWKDIDEIRKAEGL